MRISKTAMGLAIVLTACGGGGAAGGGSSTTTGRGAREVAPIPTGYHSITPALVVADVDAAIAFYAAALGATTRERIEGPNGTVMHAEIQIGDSIVMMGSEMPDHGQRAPTSLGGTSAGLFVYVEDVDATLARATDGGATIIMPASDMFWGDRYAQVRDPAGHHISLATHRFDLTPEEMQTRGQAFMAAMTSGQEPPTFTGGQPATNWKATGYFTVTPELVVTGPDAIDFYVRALGATERERVLMPDGSLMHGEIMIGDSIVMLGSELQMGETPPAMRTPAHLGAATMTLHHYVADVDAAFHQASSSGGLVLMPVEDAFWGDRYGVVGDPSGHAWGIATHVRDVSVEEIRAAAARGGS